MSFAKWSGNIPKHDIWVCLCVLKRGGVLKGIEDKTVLYYAMLSSLGYGSVAKYLYSKVKYKMRIRHGYY